MAVNGIELAPGQVWRDRSGEVGVISASGGPSYPWDTGSGATVTNDGKQVIGESNNGGDLVELIRDEQGFTIWRGGEQPAETKGVQIDVRMRDGSTMHNPTVFDLRWDHKDHPGDIVAYKILDAVAVRRSDNDDVEQVTTDAAALAAKTLSALGWRFDGQAWVQEPADTLGADTREHTGGSVSYYQIAVEHPTTDGRAPYTAEANDLIEALQMNYAEANVLKALWRICAARLGRSKRGYDDGVYDAEKIGFFGERVLVQQRREAGK